MLHMNDYSPLKIFGNDNYPFKMTWHAMNGHLYPKNVYSSIQNLTSTYFYLNLTINMFIHNNTHEMTIMPLRYTYGYHTFSSCIMFQQKFLHVFSLLLFVLHMDTKVPPYHRLKRKFCHTKTKKTSKCKYCIHKRVTKIKS